MTTMAIQKSVTNPDAGYWVPTRTMFKANETMSSGELLKLQKVQSKNYFNLQQLNVVIPFQSLN